MAKVPFSDDIIFVVLDKLKDDDWVQDLVNDLRNLFKVCVCVCVCVCVMWPVIRQGSFLYNHRETKDLTIGRLRSRCL